MPLQGTFDVLSFPDVLTLLASKKGTGRLHARSRSFTTNVFFRDGSLVAADLGEHSVSSVGDVAGRLEEICFELLEAERGSFEFMPDTMGVVESTVSMDVDDVLDRARARLAEWREIQAVVPSVDLHPRVVAALDKEEVTLSRDKWRLLTAVDGRRSIRAIARSMGMSEYDICGMVKALVEDGVLEFVGPALSLVAASRETMLFIDGSAEETGGESGPPLPAHMVQVGPPLSQGSNTAEGPAPVGAAEDGAGADPDSSLPSYPAPSGPPANLPLPPPKAPTAAVSRHGASRRERSKTVKIGRRRHPSESPASKAAAVPVQPAQPEKSATAERAATGGEAATTAGDTAPNAGETAAPAHTNGRPDGHDGPECVQ